MFGRNEVTFMDKTSDLSAIPILSPPSTKKKKRKGEATDDDDDSEATDDQSAVSFK
jgi:hypothetical protein